MKRLRLETALLFAAFFALYALTAQRGIGWGDSAEFQEWVLEHSEFVCGPQFSNAHPLYVAFCRLFAVGPTSVALVSSFFGALAVVGTFLCIRRFALAVLFGLSQMLWWLSCVAEVQTMSLAMTAFETWIVMTGLGRVRGGFVKSGATWLSAAALLSGLHLSVHNFAVLSLPVYAVLMFRSLPVPASIAVAACWALGASPWIYHAFTRGLGDVLFGSYGAKVFGILPVNWTQTGFNAFLASLSFLVPALLALWKAKSAGITPKAVLRGHGVPRDRMWIAVLFLVNFAFWIRYFVPDQSQFLLPTLFYAYILTGDAEVGGKRFAALALMQLLLPVLAYSALSRLPVPEGRRGLHGGRDDARYFAIPWRTPVSWP